MVWFSSGEQGRHNTTGNLGLFLFAASKETGQTKLLLVLGWNIPGWT